MARAGKMRERHYYSGGRERGEKERQQQLWKTGENGKLAGPDSPVPLSCDV